MLYDIGGAFAIERLRAYVVVELSYPTTEIIYHPSSSGEDSVSTNSVELSPTFPLLISIIPSGRIVPPPPRQILVKNYLNLSY